MAEHASALNSTAKLLLQALENERTLDIHYRETTMTPDERAGWMPNYKPMAQVALQRRVGWTYRLFIIAAACGICAMQFLRLLQAVLAGVRGRRPVGISAWMLATTPGNWAIILSAMQGQLPDGVWPDDVPNMDARALAQALGAPAAVRCAMSVVGLYWLIVTRCAGRRLDLLLHARDALALALLVRFAKSFPDAQVWTDDHYQRWAFLLSHTSAHLSIVQHGFLVDTIVFPHRFGAAERLAVRAERFVPMFQAYFQVRESYLFDCDLPADPVGLARPLLFLASSAPHIEEEIAFLVRFKELSSIPVTLKLHPAHVYDERMARLVALADLLCAPSARPIADLFVSHSSFMALDYERLGVITCAIADHGGGNRAAEWMANQCREVHQTL